MGSRVQLDSGVVTRCRRRVHLEHDPTMVDAPQAPPDPGVEQRLSDAAEFRRTVAEQLGARFGSEWVDIPRDESAERRAEATIAAMEAGARFVSAAQLPADESRRGGVDLLVRSEDGYLPVLVVRHRVTDRGRGARTAPLDSPEPSAAGRDEARKTRAHSRDQLRLAHVRRMLQAAGYADQRELGGVIGMDFDVVVWHDLTTPNWPDGRTALTEYDTRFADRVAVATVARDGGVPLARPSRVLECRGCPWWPVCGAELRQTRDVSLVVRGEDAVALRDAGMSTVDKLAALDPTSPDAPEIPGLALHDAVLLARAWQHDLSLVRRVREVQVPRADVELDVDMESFGDAGAYLWGCLLTAPAALDTDGFTGGYHAFATWEPLPTDDEARSFTEFWAWLTELRAAARARGLTFRAYCYNELAENRWMFASARRFTGRPGIPTVAEVRRFVESDEWVDLFASVQQNFLCAHGKGLKVIAPAAGFHWRDAEAGGENSMRWYRDAVGLNGDEPDQEQRERLLQYNEDDVRATLAIRRWMSSTAVTEVPFADDL